VASASYDRMVRL
jgi:WD40 repeat protein